MLVEENAAARFGFWKDKALSSPLGSLISVPWGCVSAHFNAKKKVHCVYSKGVFNSLTIVNWLFFI